MRVEVITEKNLWKHALCNFFQYDFVHTYDFHRVSELNGEGKPTLFIVIDNNNQLLGCWPTLRRDIPESSYFDLTSVYGYGGPIFHRSLKLEKVIDPLLSGMRQLGAISLFSRMHPLFVESIPVGPYRGQQLGDVVVIDIKPVGDILTLYRESHRREILNSRKIGVKVIVDYESINLTDFGKIYRASMSDLNADSYYNFSDEYFKKLVDSDDFKVVIIFAELDGNKIAGSMFIITGDIIQYYLSGTIAAYRKFAPSKAIIACAHALANDLGLSKLILGGGVGSTRDSLYKFKAGFSDLTYPFFVFKKILNESVYRELCTTRGVDSSTETFFPAYRAEAKF